LVYGEPSRVLVHRGQGDAAAGSERRRQDGGLQRERRRPRKEEEGAKDWIFTSTEAGRRRTATAAACSAGGDEILRPESELTGHRSYGGSPGLQIWRWPAASSTTARRREGPASRSSTDGDLSWHGPAIMGELARDGHHTETDREGGGGEGRGQSGGAERRRGRCLLPAAAALHYGRERERESARAPLRAVGGSLGGRRVGDSALAVHFSVQPQPDDVSWTPICSQIQLPRAHVLHHLEPQVLGSPGRARLASASQLHLNPMRQ